MQRQTLAQWRITAKPELNSWKEIAGRLDVSVRTAQLWERQRGLPVRRMPGGRSRVFVRVDELEAWMLGADPGNAVANQPALSSTHGPLTVWASGLVLWLMAWAQQ